MTLPVIDVAALRDLMRAERQSTWCVDGVFIYGNGTKYSFGSFESEAQAKLSCAAVNALPELLALYEAASATRDLMDFFAAEATKKRPAPRRTRASKVIDGAGISAAKALPPPRKRSRKEAP